MDFIYFDSERLIHHINKNPFLKSCSKFRYLSATLLRTEYLEHLHPYVQRKEEKEEGEDACERACNPQPPIEAASHLVYPDHPPTPPGGHTGSRSPPSPTAAAVEAASVCLSLDKR